MAKILVALVLGVAILLPTAAFANDESGPDHAVAGVTEAIQTEPIQLGTLSGPEQAPSMPYFDLRQDNRE